MIPEEQLIWQTILQTRAERWPHFNACELVGIYDMRTQQEKIRDLMEDVWNDMLV